MSEIRSHLAALRPHLTASPEANLAFAKVSTEAARLVESVRVGQARDIRVRRLLERAAVLDWSAGITQLGMSVLQVFVEVLEADRGLIALVEPDGRVSPIATVGVDDGRPGWSSGVVEQAFQSCAPFVTADARQEDAIQNRLSVGALRLRSVCCVPVVAEGVPLGFVWLENRRRVGVFDEDAVQIIGLWLPVLSAGMDQALRTAHGLESPIPGFVTRSPRLIGELRDLARVAPFDVSILLTGETGTGKSMLARMLHRISPRNQGPFVHVNCGAIPEGILDAELFGAEKGAFTGATARRIGYFEAADKGTIFLDELDTMPLVSQVRLLVTLQDRTIMRLGSSTPVPVDVRILAATSRPPHQLVKEGTLRADLYYRLAVVMVDLPPLRERKEDLPILLDSLLDRLRCRHRLQNLRLSQSAYDEVLTWSWPGNVRELENTLERAALLADGGVIHSLRLKEETRGEVAPPRKGGAVSQAEFERAMALANHNPNEAARILGIHRRSILRLAARFGR